MTDARIELDRHRGMAAQDTADLRRRRLEVRADEDALGARQDALERTLVALPTENRPEAVKKARYLAAFSSRRLIHAPHGAGA
jgi:hypothetical protein